MKSCHNGEFCVICILPHSLSAFFVLSVYIHTLYMDALYMNVLYICIYGKYRYTQNIYAQIFPKVLENFPIYVYSSSLLFLTKSIFSK